LFLATAARRITALPQLLHPEAIAIKQQAKSYG
jgi:hypothetical protein